MAPWPTLLAVPVPVPAPVAVKVSPTAGEASAPIRLKFVVPIETIVYSILVSNEPAVTILSEVICKYGDSSNPDPP